MLKWTANKLPEDIWNWGINTNQSSGQIVDNLKRKKKHWFGLIKPTPFRLIQHQVIKRLPYNHRKTVKSTDSWTFNAKSAFGPFNLRAQTHTQRHLIESHLLKTLNSFEMFITSLSHSSSHYKPFHSIIQQTSIALLSVSRLNH